MIKSFLSFFAPTYLKELVEKAKRQYESMHKTYLDETVFYERRLNYLRDQVGDETNYKDRLEKQKREQAAIDKGFADLQQAQEIFVQTKKAEMSSLTEEVKAQKAVIAEKDSVIKNLHETIDKLIKTIETPKVSVVK